MLASYWLLSCYTAVEVVFDFSDALVVFPIAQLLGAKRLTGISCDLASIAPSVAKYLAVADLIAVSSVLRSFPASYAFVPFGHV